MWVPLRIFCDSMILNMELFRACHTTKPFLAGSKEGIEATKRNVRQKGTYTLRGIYQLPVLRAPALGAPTLRSDGFLRQGHK